MVREGRQHCRLPILENPNPNPNPNPNYSETSKLV